MPPHPFILSPVLPLPCPPQGLACDHLEELTLQVCLEVFSVLSLGFLSYYMYLCENKTNTLPYLLSIVFPYIPLVVGYWPLCSLAYCVSIPLEIANPNNLSYHAQTFSFLSICYIMLKLRKVACCYLNSGVGCS